MMQTLPWERMMLEGAIVLTLMLLSHGLRKRLSLAPFFAVMGALTLLSWWSGMLMLQMPQSTTPSATLAILIPALIAGLMLTYVTDGPKAARVLLSSIVLLSLASPAFGMLFVDMPPDPQLTRADLIDTHGNWRAALAGSLALALDFLLLGTCWEVARRWLAPATRILMFPAALVLAGLMDLYAYQLLFNALQGEFGQLQLAERQELRIIIQLAYGVLLTPYLALQIRRNPDDDHQRPLLAALEQESRLQAEIVSIREEMARKASLEQSLHERSALFHSLFELSPAGILLCNRAGEIQEANPPARALLRPDEDGRPANRIQQLLPAESIVHLLDGVREHRQSQPVLEEIHGKEYAITAVSVNLGQDQQGVAYLLQDLSERQRMEDELIRHDRLESLSILAGGIAHDFNNLLTGVLAGLSLARMQLAEAEPIESMKTLDEVEEQVKLASRLTQQLLTFSKGGEPALRNLSLNGFLQESVRFGLRGASVSATFDLEDKLWPVKADQGQLHQVINNLVINAVQAMEGKGQIHIHAGNLLLNQQYKTLPAGRYVRIEVCDEGPGIPEHLLDRIFDPFFTTKKSGHGLGLASSFSILKRHHGLLEVENRPQGGACFRIYLPPGDLEAEPHVRTVTVSQYRARVLVMDDQETILKLLTRMLEKIGLEVTTARTGEEAIILYQQALASGHKYDLVILDLTVPDGMGGQECMRNLLEIDPSVKAVVSSGYSDDPVMARAEQYGFIDRLAKPYTIGDAWALITRVLPEHAQRDDT